MRDPQDIPIEGVLVTLTGTDIFGNAVLYTQLTDVDGFYSFSGLNPGTYNVEIAQPIEYRSTGSVGGHLSFDANGDPVYDTVDREGDTVRPNDTSGNTTQTDVNTIENIVLGEGDNSIENNF